MQIRNVNILQSITGILFFVFFLGCEDYQVENLGCESKVICLDLQCADNGSTDCLDELLADGNTTLRVIARVPALIDPAKNNITFRTTTGEFVGEQNPQAPILKAIDGQAIALLRVGTQAGSYKISAEVSDGTTTYVAVTDIHLDTVSGPLFDFEFIGGDTSNLPADGSSILLLRTYVQRIDFLGKSLVLDIGGGWAFASQTASSFTHTIGQYPYFENYIKVGQVPGPCFLTATVEGLSSTILVNTVQAEPESMTLIPQSQVIDSSNGSVQLAAYLFRANGKVSIGTALQLEAVQQQGNSSVNAGWFDPPYPVSDANGQVDVTFHTWADGTVLSQVPILVHTTVAHLPSVGDSITLHPR